MIVIGCYWIDYLLGM